MSVDAEPRNDVADDRVDQLAAEFGEAITEMPVYQRFAEAKQAVEADEDAQERIQEFEAIREDFVLARQTGQADEDDLRELQAAQEELHELDVMSDFLAAQSELELRLQELNELVSDELVIDFGQKAGGCCEE